MHTTKGNNERDTLTFTTGAGRGWGWGEGSRASGTGDVLLVFTCGNRTQATKENYLSNFDLAARLLQPG